MVFIGLWGLVFYAVREETNSTSVTLIGKIGDIEGGEGETTPSIMDVYPKQSECLARARDISHPRACKYIATSSFHACQK